jgi:hypothetical protein
MQRTRAVSEQKKLILRAHKTHALAEYTIRENTAGEGALHIREASVQQLQQLLGSRA